MVDGKASATPRRRPLRSLLKATPFAQGWPRIFPEWERRCEFVLRQDFSFGRGSFRWSLQLSATKLEADFGMCFKYVLCHASDIGADNKEIPSDHAGWVNQALAILRPDPHSEICA